MQPARSVDDDDVGTDGDSPVHRVEGDRCRVGGLRTAHHLGTHPRGPALQLIGRGGAEGVGRTEHDAPSIGDENPGQLADGGGLAGAIDPDNQEHRWLLGVWKRFDRAVQARV